MRKRFVFIGICLLPALLLAQAEKPKVRVGAGYSVPRAYLGPDGTPTGLYVEVMRDAARREGMAFEILFRKDGPDKALHSGEIDLWAAAVPTEERRKTLYFTSPWWAQDHYLGVLSSSAIQGVADLDGKLVVYSATPPFTADLRTALPAANLKVLNDLRARFAAVCDGSADAVLFYQETSLFSVTGSNEFAECRERGLRLIPLGRTVMETAITALPEKRELADRFRRRIDEMRQDQTLARLAASPLAGTQALTQLLQAERTQYHDRLLQLSVFSLSTLLLLAGIAYFRLRRANRQTREALAAAEHASRAKSEFLATMSHEIRTPLTAVIGYMEMLSATSLRPDQRRYALEVTQASSSLLTLMTTILGYARSGQPTPEVGQSLDPAAVLDDCLAAVLLDAEAKKLSLTVEVSPTVPRLLQGDPVRLRQSLLNLMANAVKFTPSGWVTVQVSYADGKLICVVADSGAGIPVEKRTQIFEPFTQLDSTDTRRFGGVGLGLAVVADLCRQLGGSIQVDTAEGGGARFTLQLPYAAVPGEGGWLESRATGVAVLLAADSPAIRIFTTYLGHAGLAVIRFRDAGQWRCWTPPAEGHIFCFVDGAVFGPTPPPWCNPKTITVLLGGMNYLRSLSESQKSQFDDVLPLPVPARSLREILHPVSVRSSPLPLPSRLHVLVVDDNAVNRRVLTALLEKLGCHVDTARNGREAVDAFVRDRYAAILMDCQMPVMNGYEAAAEIRRHPAGKDLAICGISASTDAETRDRCHASGMNEYLPKPVTLENLHDLLTRIAAQRVIAENLRRDV